MRVPTTAVSLTRRKWLRVAGICLLPTAVASRWIAFQMPSITERWYGQIAYPRIAAALAAINRQIPASIAEMLAALLLTSALWLTVRWLQRRKAGLSPSEPAGNRIGAFLVTLWISAGVIVWAFLLTWGLNYARPGLQVRLQLPIEGIAAPEVLALGSEMAERAAYLYADMEADPTQPSRLPMSLRDLDRLVANRLQALALPGDTLAAQTAPAKPLASSRLLSYLGISGIFIPFTGEPSINVAVPDVLLPVVVAHEKAHRRGVTDEGEADLAAVLACLGSEDAYLRYAASLYSASLLLAEAARYVPESARDAWESLGPGPLTDLRAVREFWERHQGPAARVAQRVNDAYLRSNQVPGGVESYGHVAQLLIGLHRRGDLGAGAPSWAAR